MIIILIVMMMMMMMMIVVMTKNVVKDNDNKNINASRLMMSSVCAGQSLVSPEHPILCIPVQLVAKYQ